MELPPDPYEEDDADVLPATPVRKDDPPPDRPPQVELPPDPYEEDDADVLPAQVEIPDDDSSEPATARAPDDAQNSLEQAESLVDRARRVSNALFKEARRMPEYRRMLATLERNEQFEKKLLATARMIDSRFGKDSMLPPDARQHLVTRLANRITAWEHSPDRQRERQRKQVAKIRRKNRGRDLEIVRLRENGESQRSIAKQLDISRGAVRNVLKRARDEQDQPRVGYPP